MRRRTNAAVSSWFASLRDGGPAGLDVWFETIVVKNVWAEQEGL